MLDFKDTRLPYLSRIFAASRWRRKVLARACSLVYIVSVLTFFEHMTKDLKIERNVPIRNRRSSVFATMEVGDSVWVDEHSTAGPTYRRAINTNKDRGWKFCGAQENGGIRIWRVK